MSRSIRLLLAAALISGVGLVSPSTAGADDVVAKAEAIKVDCKRTERVRNLGKARANATQALQAALDKGGCVSIEDTGGTIYTGPLFVKHDNVKISFAKGVRLGDLEGAYPDRNDRMFTANGVTNLIFEGYGATLQMDNSRYTTGEWRHLLSINSAQNVRIEGLTFSGSGGDSIYLGDKGPNDTAADARHHNVNVHIKNVTSLGARRNGLSVIGVDGLLVEGSEFSGAAGNNPQYGIDFEPNRPTQRMTNVLVRDVRFAGNGQGCVMWAPYHSDGTTEPFSVTVERFRCEHTGHYPALALLGPKVSDPGGTLTFRDGLISHEGGAISNSIAMQHMQPQGTKLTLERVSVFNVGGKTTDLGYVDADQPLPPLLVSSGRLGNQADTVEAFGGAKFVDNVVVTDHALPFLATYKEDRWPSGVTGLTGNFTVFNPIESGRSLGLGPRAHGNDVRVAGHALAPQTWVSAAAGKLGRCEARFTVTRKGKDLSYPLAVRYRVDGDVAERINFVGTAGVVVIPAGEASAEVPVRLLPGSDLKGKLLRFTLEPSAPGWGVDATNDGDWRTKKFYDLGVGDASILLGKKSCR